MRQNLNQIKKLGLIFIIFAIIVSFSIFVIRELWFEQRAQKLSLHNALDKTLERENVVADYLDQTEDYLLFLRNSDAFTNYLNKAISRQDLEDFILSYMAVNPDFMRLRYVDADGNEIVRVERSVVNGQATIVATDLTENIASEYYFTEPQNNGLEQVWYSAFDLNIENDEITTPYLPTFRAVLPIEHDDAFDGELVINLFTEDFIEKLTDTPLYDMILYNDNGEIIYHYQQKNGLFDKSWGNVIDHHYNLSDEFPDQYLSILSSDTLETSSFVSRHFDLPVYEGLNMVLQLKSSYLITEQQRKTSEYVTIFLIVMLFSGLLTYLILKLFSRTLLNVDELQRLNETLKSATHIAKIGFLELNPASKKIHLNEGIAEIYHEEDLEDISFEEYLSYLSPDDQKLLIQNFNQSVLEKSEFSITHKITTSDQQIKYVEQRGRHFYNQQGQHIKSIGSIYDVTEKFFVNKKYEMMLNNASDGLFFMDLNGNLIEFSKKAAILLGYTESEMASLNIYDWDREMTPELWSQLIDNTRQNSLDIERTLARKDQTTFIAHITANIFEIGDESFVYASIRDISLQKETQKALEDSQLRWQFAVEGNKDGLWDWNLNTGEVFLSDQLKKMIGYDQDDLKDSMEEWQELIHPDDRSGYLQAINSYRQGKSDTYIKEYRVLTKQDQYIWIRDKAVIVERNDDQSPRRIIGTHTDITEYIDALELIKKQTYIDDLTQLNNRKAYDERIIELLGQYQRYQFPFSMMMLDIDHFKTVNDTYGHDKGDEVMVQIGALLKEFVRINDYIFRIGGEEFIILLTGTGLEHAGLFAEKIRSHIEHNLAQNSGLSDSITISIGVVNVTEADTFETLYKRVDRCLYQAKESGRNKVILETLLQAE